VLQLPCTGQRPNSSLVEDLAPEAISKKTKEILVRPTLQIATDQKQENSTLANIFALGDVAATGGPKNARSSLFQAEVVLKNMLAIINGDAPLNTYKPHGFVEGALGLSLGKVTLVLYIHAYASIYGIY
jgi:apoptosis-inducing factor 2